jgi:hypothetical protein
LLKVGAISIEAIEFDGGLVVVDQIRHRMLAYNRSAARVWDAHAVGLSPDQIASHIAAGGAIPISAARRQIDLIIDHWRSEGLLSSTKLSSSRQPEPTRPTRDVMSAREPVWSRRWLCRVGPLAVSFAVEPEPLVANIRTLLRPFEIAEATPDVKVEVRHAGSGDAVLIADGIERTRARLCEPGAFKEAAHRTIIERLYATEARWLPAIHAGAMARGGKAIIFPAHSGSGKTTLLAFLMSQGYDYLADDFVALLPPEGKILPWPLPLSIKSGSLDIIQPLYPDLSNVFTFRTKGDVARLLVPPASCWTSSPIKPSCLVFPQYNPKVETSLRPIQPLEAFQRILEAGVWLGHPLRRDNVQTFLDWLAAVPSFALSFTDVRKALDQLELIPGFDSR